MKRFVSIVLVSGLTIYLIGCGKKEQPISETQEPISMEELGRIDASIAPEAGAKAAPTVTLAPSSTVTPTGTKSAEVKLEQLPPSGPYKPTVSEVQTALKNAGFYTGMIDGKKGPLTNKAIEDFQKANGLEADGKVGPKTWAVLSKFLNMQP